MGVPDAHSAAHLATLARPAQHASRVQSARWPMCRVHTARPCTPPQGVDTPQLRRPLRGVCEAIVVRTHHDDRATATPSEAATGARWFPKGGLPRRLLRHGRPSWRDCSVAPGAMGRSCRDRTADTLRLRRRRYAAWSGDDGDGYAAGWCPGGAAKPSDRQTPQRGRFAPVAKECACRNRITKRAAPTALPLLRRWWQWRRGGGVVVAVAAMVIRGMPTVELGPFVNA